MSVASQISRITNLRDRIRGKLITLGLLQGQGGGGGGGQRSANDLEDCTDAIEGIGGTQYIINTQQVNVVGNGKQYAQVQDSNLIPSNIASGVTILGVTGTHSGQTPSQVVSGGTYPYGQAAAPAIVYPIQGEVFGSVAPELVQNPVLIPSNIKSGVTIMGVTGNYVGSGYQYTSDTTQFAANFRYLNYGLTTGDVSDIRMYVLKDGPNAMETNEVVFVEAHWSSSGTSYCRVCVNNSSSELQIVSGTIDFSQNDYSVIIDTGSNTYFFGRYDQSHQRQYLSFVFYR